MVKIAVMVTDINWFKFLRNEQDLQTVNFWSPSGIQNTQLVKGELVLFKLKAPVNKIAGGGIYTHFEKLPWKMAWDSFGRGNGAQTADIMHDRIIRYRKNKNSVSFDVGCTIISNPFFLRDIEFLDQPADWKSSTVRGKYYYTSEQIGLQLWHDVHHFLQQDTGGKSDRFGPPQLIHPRLGQGAFRSLIRANYGHRCAITRERTLPVLEAAHIKPYSQGGLHELSNGILFRSDIHKLFDDGYVTVTPKLKFEVSQRIREEYQNGKVYYNLNGKDIFVPSEENHVPPDPSLLEWHNNNCYNG